MLINRELIGFWCRNYSKLLVVRDYNKNKRYTNITEQFLTICVQIKLVVRSLRFPLVQISKKKSIFYWQKTQLSSETFVMKEYTQFVFCSQVIVC